MPSFADPAAPAGRLTGRLIPSIDLQWFAAEDEGRTEDPTDITYRKAREEGRVAKSQEFSGALVLLFPAAAIILLAPSMLNTCVEMIRFYFERAAELDPVKDRLAGGMFFRYFAKLAWPIALVACLSGILANVIQTRGFLFTSKPLVPDFSRVFPHFIRYFQRTLFSMEGLFNLLKNIAKMAIIGVVVYILFLGPLVSMLMRIITHSDKVLETGGEIGRLVNLQKADLWQSVTFVASLAARLLIISALLLLALSIPDWIFQRWQFRESLKMTRQTAKEELRQYEGDPMIRSKLRARYRELLSRDMMKNVPNADVVVTNPTHFAVALEYDQERMNGPTVTAKGEDDMALHIRRIAEENGVPVREIPPLARALYRDTELGEEISPYYYTVVATLLASVLGIEKEKPQSTTEERIMKEQAHV